MACLPIISDKGDYKIAGGLDAKVLKFISVNGQWVGWGIIKKENICFMHYWTLEGLSPFHPSCNIIEKTINANTQVKTI